ncbi:MAG TPA: PaaI family thioesterase [Actinomycetota bacterium]|nr:PaaI family thioesterase [Actinomycetota bacterium]
MEEPEFDSPHPYEREAKGEVLDAKVWEEKSGMEILQGHISGDVPLPPIAHLTGVRPVGGSEGTSTFRLPTSPWFCVPHGNIQGGLVALIADHALTGAIGTTIPAGGGYAALDLKLNLVRPVAPDTGDLEAVGRIVSRGRRTAVATAEVRNAEGKPVAIAMSSGAIVDRPVTSLRPLSAVEEN